MTCPFWSGPNCDDCPTPCYLPYSCTDCKHAELPTACKHCDFYYPEKGCSVHDEIKEWSETHCPSTTDP